MAWWGKIVGGTFGFMLGGPLGAAFGAAIGHSFDKGVSQPHYTPGTQQEQIQAAFFTATFSVMGHIAKADGRVTPDEIALAATVMRNMALNREQTKVAQGLFNQGKQGQINLDQLLRQFRQVCGRRRNLLLMFVEVQIHAAYADGSLHPGEARVLERIAVTLGFNRVEFDQIEARVKAERAGGGPGRARPSSDAMSLDDAYGVLGIGASASDPELKKAYRRLMNQHHPDKLVAKGLPEEMMKIATEKAQNIKAAYEIAKRDRGLK